MNQCQGQTIRKTQCKKMTNSNYCHLHKHQEIIIPVKQDTYKIEVNRLNNSIQKKNEIINNQKQELKANHKTIHTLKKKIENMQEFYEAYQVIKEYDELKTRIKAIVNFTSDYYINNSLQKYTNEIRAQFNMTPEELKNYYFDLKSKRNISAHPLTYIKEV